MIDPKTVLIATPTHDGKVEAGYAGGLAAVFASGFAGNTMFLAGNSDIGAARNHIANAFLQSQFEWLICIDADIQFTAADFGLLMSVEPDVAMDRDADPMPEMMCYTRVEGRPGELKGAEGIVQFEYAPELAVTAEYARKTELREPIRFGMGFVRLHRSVFEKLDALKNEEGIPIIDQFMHQGRLVSDYFPAGTDGEGRRHGEDGAFWLRVRLAGITPRIETRTKLVHWGRQAYPYVNSLRRSHLTKSVFSS